MPWGREVNKLPLANLPSSKAGFNDYERILNVKLNELFQAHRDAINALIQNPNLPVYASNAAALAGGLVAGQFYRTATGTVMVTY